MTDVMETTMFDHVIAYYHHLADQSEHNHILWIHYLDLAYNYIKLEQ